MITLTLGRDTRARTNPASAVVRPDGEGMGDLLHDTALLVTTLASGGTVRSAAQFRERCGELVGQFDDALTQRNYPEDVKREALVAQCGLLDEVALRHLPGDARDAWEVRPMQVERFGIYDAGRRIIDRIDAHLQESSPELDLLEFYAAIMAMGFVGRYARDGQEKRAALITAINVRLDALRAARDKAFICDPSGARLHGGLARVLPWAVLVLVCLVAVAVWMTGRGLLDAQLLQVGPARIIGS